MASGSATDAPIPTRLASNTATSRPAREGERGRKASPGPTIATSTLRSNSRVGGTKGERPSAQDGSDENSGVGTSSVAAFSGTLPFDRSSGLPELKIVWQGAETREGADFAV
jgi:hypothetical protein